MLSSIKTSKKKYIYNSRKVSNIQIFPIMFISCEKVFMAFVKHLVLGSPNSQKKVTAVRFSRL
jgi:hypothetical protein